MRALLLLATLTPGVAVGQEVVDLAEEAEIAFELGVQHLERGQYLAGLSHLLRSNRLAPNRNVVFNIAGAYEALARYEQAYQAYTDYVALETDPERRKDGEAGLERLRDRVALVRVTSDPPGATIYVDRTDLGARGVTPRTIALSPGEHTVILEADGYADAREGTRVARATESSLSVTLVRLLGQVRVFGEPDGAEVRLEGDSVPIGTIPGLLEVPVGSAVLDVTAAGYAPRKVVVEVSQDAVAQVDASLALRTGRVVVDAPGHPGAMIEVDGEVAAFTPAVLDLPVGAHTVRVAASGYGDIVQQVDVREDTPVDLDVRLRGNVLDPLVVSASRTAELASQAPVPVTVVTSDMIRAIGARTLKDVLEIYVPGMTNVVDHNELNVAMRGVYASSQQKILVMVDGHRLNSRAYSMANPDYSILVSPDRIQQIEILRGPGSAAYGNIAFTAVVNLITRKGRDIGGFVARAGGGNFGQQQASVVYGGDHGEDDLVLWGGVYRALGEEVAVSAAQDYAPDLDGDGVPDGRAGNAIVGGVRDPASYDVGMIHEVGHIEILANARYGKHTEPFTSAGTTGQVYDGEIMRTIQGVGPGLGSRSNHLRGQYRNILSDRHGVDVSAYVDTNEVKGNLTTGYDTHIVLNWQELGGGGIAQYTLGYDALGRGSVLLGGQIDVMNVRDGLLVGGAAGEWDTVNDTNAQEVLLPGQEATYSAYVQLRHEVLRGASTSPILLNAGGRLDYKVRRPGEPSLGIPDQDDILDLSPRLAVILHPVEPFTTKLSYAESFVDAPYWYRYNNLASYAGAVTLTPERLRAAQLTPELTLLDGRFKTTTNLAYQNVFNFIFRDATAAGTPADPFYKNAGKLDTFVVEEELAFLETALRARANATYQHVLSVESYDAPADGRGIHNVPAFVGNLILDVNPLTGLNPDLWTNLTLRYVGPQRAPIRAVSAAQPDLEANLLHEQPGILLLDVGARASRIVGGLSVDGRIYNLLDTGYTQGGSTLHPYPQPGRWFLVNLEWAFDPRGKRGAAKPD